MPARRATAVGPDGSPLPAEGGKEKLTFGCAFPGCGQTYSRMEYLKRHQRKHQDERPFQCKDCSKAFARSDVLLRHRRRCHPTPPPRDRSSHSPLPAIRAHPSVPISSSRTSEREASPIRGGRKHARNSEGSSHGEPAASRARLSPEEDDDEDRYGSRFSRNGMGNGGVFGVTNAYYSGNPVSTEGAYDPNLLPMFQNTANAYHNMHDPNHLEDASVLLSMAYPGGVPGSDPSPNGEERSDWDATNAIGSIITGDTNTSADDTDPTRESNFSSGAVDNPARPAAPGAVLPESLGNLASMNWLANGSADVTTSSWPSTGPSQSPLSPFNLSQLFATSPFGLSPGVGALTNETTAMAIAAAAAAADEQANASNGLITLNDNTVISSDDDAVQHANAVVAAILNQIAMNDVPETRANPNPERPLLRLANQDLVNRSGQEIPKNTRFYLPADRFAGCYQIPHWALPPLRTLSVMAARTYYSVLNHFSFVHDPTFQLIDTAACLAFAICTVGGLRIGANRKFDSSSTENTYNPPGQLVASSPDGWRAEGAWEGVHPNFAIGVDPDEEDRRRVEEWEGGQIVRHEKTNMLVKSFSLAQGVLMTEYNVALLQALILYHAPYFLSKSEHERRHANMFLGTIVTITRQIGFFLPDLEHAEVNLTLPKPPYTPTDVDIAWRHWVQLESRRRTAYLVYHLDTVSALESQFPPIISPTELAALPLPAPDNVWKAPTAEQWLQAMQVYRPMTLDQAMRRLFNLPTSGRFDELGAIDPTRNLLSEVEYGPFARTAMAITLLRGICELGEGKRDRGDWRDLTDLWISATHLRPSSRCITGEGIDLGACTPDALRTRYSYALQRWRDGWDGDSLCSTPGQSPAPSDSPASSTLLTPLVGATSPSGSNSGKSPKPKLVYCEEAMSFYFLATALLNMLLSNPTSNPSRNALADVNYCALLEASRTLSRAGNATTSAPMF